MTWTQTVRFRQACEVRDHLGAVVERFEAGQLVELPVASAERWVRRGKAVLELPDAAPAAAPPPEDPGPGEPPEHLFAREAGPLDGAPADTAELPDDAPARRRRGR